MQCLVGSMPLQMRYCECANTESRLTTSRPAFSLNQHMGRGDNAVNEAGMVQLHLFLKRDKTAHILNTQHIREQRQPNGFNALANALL